MTGPVTGKAKSLYDEMKITDKCAVSEGSDKNFLYELRLE